MSKYDINKLLSKSYEDDEDLKKMSRYEYETNFKQRFDDDVKIGTRKKSTKELRQEKEVADTRVRQIQSERKQLLNDYGIKTDETGNVKRTVDLDTNPLLSKKSYRDNQLVDTENIKKSEEFKSSKDAEKYNALTNPLVKNWNERALLNEEINKREAKREAKGYGTIAKIGASLGTGVVNKLSGLTRNNEDAILDESGNPLYYTKNRAELDSEAYRNSLSGVAGGLYDLGNLVGEMATQYIPGVGQTLYFGDIAMDKYNENLRNGVDAKDAFINATGVSIVDYFKQKALGSLGSRASRLESGTEKSLENAFEKGFSHIIGNKSVNKILSGTSAEFLDEFTDSIVEQMWDNVTINKNGVFEGMDSPEFWKQATYEGLLGGIMGLGGASIKVGSTSKSQRASEQAVYDYERKTGNKMSEFNKNTVDRIVNLYDSIYDKTPTSQEILDSFERIKTNAINDFQTDSLNKFPTLDDAHRTQFNEMLNDMSQVIYDTGVNIRLDPTQTKLVDWDNGTLVLNPTRTAEPLKNIVLHEISKQTVDSDTQNYIINKLKEDGIYETYKNELLATGEFDELNVDSEIVAQELDAIFQNENEIKELAEKDKGLFNNIKDTFNTLTGKLTNNRNTRDALYFREVNDRINSLYGKGDLSDLSKIQSKPIEYSETAKKTLENLKNKGYEANTTEAQLFNDFVSKISNDKGIEFDFTNNKELKKNKLNVNNRVVNGYNDNGKIVVNMDSPRALNTIVGHEITHSLENSQYYKDLQKVLFNYAKDKGEYDSRYNDIKELYKNVENADIDSELTADLVGDYIFTDSKFINDLSKKDKNLFERILDELRYIWRQLTGTKQQKELDKAIKMFEKAYKDNSVNLEKQTKYSLTQDSNGRELSKEQQEYFKDSKVRDENGNLLEMYHGTAQDFTVFTDKYMGKFQGNSLGYGYYFTTDYNTADTYRQYAKGNGYGKVMKVYLKMTNPFNIYPNMNQDGDLLNQAEYLMTKYDVPGIEKNNIAYDTHLEYVKGKLNKNYKAIDYIKSLAYKNNIQTSDILKELGYDGIVADKEYVVFDSNQIKNVDNKAPTSNPDIRYSLSTDSNGRELSQQQQEYFKDSKTRDNNGNLITYYNGGGNYTIFDRTKMSDGSKWGKGIYLTKYRDIANMYGDNVKEVYVNIENPVSDRLKTITFEEYNNLFKALYDEDTYKEEYDMYSNDLDLLWDITNKGNWADYAEQLKEYTGKDGIIINRGEPREDMVIAFNSNQIKNVDNTNPTENEDIRYSLSQQNQEYGDYNVYGKDFTKQKTKIKEQYKSNEKLPETTKQGTYIEPTKPIDTTTKKGKKYLQQISGEGVKNTLLKSKAKNYTAFVDKLNPIQQIADASGNNQLYAKYNNRGMSNGMGQYQIGTAQTDINGREIGKSLNDIWKPIEDANLTIQFDDYLAHRLNEERYEKVPVWDESVTPEMSREIINKYDSQYPQFKSWADEIYKFNDNQLQKMIDAGLSKENARDWLYKNYVTISRDLAPKTNPLVQNAKGVKVNSPIRKAKGGNADIRPMKEAMARQTLLTENAIADNIAGQELLNVLGGTVGDKNTFLTQDLEGNNNALMQNEDGTYNYTVYKNGIPVTMQITKEVADAIRPTKRGEWEELAPFKAVRGVSQLQRTLLTDKNPLFIFTNFFKDIGDAPLNSKYSGGQFYMNYPVAVAKMLKKDSDWKQYVAKGGKENTYFDTKTGEVTLSKNAIKRTAQKFSQLIENANQFIEQAPRFNEYLLTLQNGGTLDEALYNSAEVTTNFARGGEITKALNRNGFNFLNASVQGFDKQIRNFTKQPGAKGYVQLLAKVAIFGIAPAMLNHMLLEDDDDYEELPDYIKNSYYLFKTGDNKFIRIPKGRVMSIFGTSARHTYETAQGNESILQGLKDTGEQIVNNVAPNNPIENNVISPLLSVKNNKSWNGSAIVSTRLQNLPDSEQYDEKTSSIAKWLGKTFNYSPKKIDYVLDQYTGAIGDFVLPMTTPSAESEFNTIPGKLIASPFVSKFTADSTISSKYVSEFYDTKDKLEKEMKLYSSIDESEESFEKSLQAKYLANVNEEVADLYAQKREIQNSELDDKTKYNQARDIQRKIDDITKFALQDYTEGYYTDSYGIVGDKEYHITYSQGKPTWSKVDEKTKKKQEEYSFKYDMSPEVYYGMDGLTKTKITNGDLSKYNEMDSKLKAITDKTSNDKEATFEYVNKLDMPLVQKAMYIKMHYPSYNEYNKEIFDWVNANSYDEDEMKAILIKLGYDYNKYTKQFSWK